MRKQYLIILLAITMMLGGCGIETDTVGFKERRENDYISESDRVLIHYKTNEIGQLVNISFDRLLTIEELLFIQSERLQSIEQGLETDVLVDASSRCTDVFALEVPLNIKIGTTVLKYSTAQCGYVEVDRDNIEKSGSYIRRYDLDETIDVSTDTIISVVYFDETSVERFVVATNLYHTMKQLGIYASGYLYDEDMVKTEVIFLNTYAQDMGYLEHFILFYQDQVVAIDRINGLSSDVYAEATDPLIENFNIVYLEEILAVNELFLDIRLQNDQLSITIDEEEGLVDE
jgi:hypothetical protein